MVLISTQLLRKKDQRNPHFLVQFVALMFQMTQLQCIVIRVQKHKISTVFYNAYSQTIPLTFIYLRIKKLQAINVSKENSYFSPNPHFLSNIPKITDARNSV